MRLFTAIDVPSHTKAQMAALIARLRPFASLRWSPEENLHITTKFIGEVSAMDVEQVEGALAEVAKQSGGAIPIDLTGLDWLPSESDARILHVAVSGPRSLDLLHQRTDLALVRLGIEREIKPFRPHVTLARIPAEVELHGLREEIARLGNLGFESFQATEFGLYESVAERDGSIYRRRAAFPLRDLSR